MYIDDMDRGRIHERGAGDIVDSLIVVLRIYVLTWNMGSIHVVFA